MAKPKTLSWKWRKVRCWIIFFIKPLWHSAIHLMSHDKIAGKLLRWVRGENVREEYDMLVFLGENKWHEDRQGEVSFLTWQFWIISSQFLNVMTIVKTLTWKSLPTLVSVEFLAVPRMSSHLFVIGEGKLWSLSKTFNVFFNKMIRYFYPSLFGMYFSTPRL